MLKKIWNRLQEYTLKDIINYLKERYGEAEVLADRGNFASWAAYIVAILKDLVSLITGDTTKTKAASAPVFATALVARIAKERKSKKEVKHD